LTVRAQILLLTSIDVADCLSQCASVKLATSHLKARITGGLDAVSNTNGQYFQSRRISLNSPRISDSQGTVRYDGNAHRLLLVFAILAWRHSARLGSGSGYSLDLNFRSGPWPSETAGAAPPFPVPRSPALAVRRDRSAGTLGAQEVRAKPCRNVCAAVRLARLRHTQKARGTCSMITRFPPRPSHSIRRRSPRPAPQPPPSTMRLRPAQTPRVDALFQLG